MAYAKIGFKDRVDNKPDSYLVNGTETTVVKDDSSLISKGTNLNKSTFDHLENGIYQNSIDISNVNNTVTNNKGEFDTFKTETTSHLAESVTQELGVHEFRVVGRKAQVYNKVTSEWENIKAGTEVKVGNVLSLSVDEDDEFVIIKWQDPGDTIIDVNGEPITFAEWGGTQLRYKLGNFPTGEKDGTLLVDNKVKNQYKTTGYKHIGLTNDVTIYYMLFPYTKDDVFTVDSANRISATPTEIDANSWAGIQKIVRKGITNDFFTVGDQIQANYDGVPTIFEVIGIDVETPTDLQYTHSMTLQTKNILHNMMFDNKEPNNPNADRKSYGNNRYIHSAIRQWLNSNEVTFNWQSQHSYDAAPTGTMYSGAGFLNRLDPELASVLGAVDKKVALNTVTDGSGQETFSDKVFLLSPKEVGYTSSEMNNDGVYTGESVYPFYTGASDTDRIKQLNSSNTAWWLRSPLVSLSYGVRYVYSGGPLDSSRAHIESGVSPACVII